MENGHAKAEKPTQARCFIDEGVLRIEVPLFTANGEYLAYGMLHKATQVVAAFFRHLEREAQRDSAGPRILTPKEMPRPN